jgi:hypothetical protein
MGIDIGWKIIQGAPLEAWEEALGEDEQMIDNFDGDLAWFLEEGLGINSVSPRYDSDSSERVFGVELAKGDYPKDINLRELSDRAVEIAQELEAKYGVKTTTVCSQDVW